MADIERESKNTDQTLQTYTPEKYNETRGRKK